MAKGEIRIDKWLWAVRVFKTRTIATEACKKGRVTMENGIVVKPSRTIKVGDVINVRKSPVTYSFRVLLFQKIALVPSSCRNIWKTSPRNLNSTFLKLSK